MQIPEEALVVTKNNEEAAETNMIASAIIKSFIDNQDTVKKMRTVEYVILSDFCLACQNKKGLGPDVSKVLGYVITSDCSDYTFTLSEPEGNVCHLDFERTSYPHTKKKSLIPVEISEQGDKYIVGWIKTVEARDFVNVMDKLGQITMPKPPKEDD